MRLVMIFFCVLLFAACRKQVRTADYPECVQRVVDQNGSPHLLEVKQYEWNSEPVYMFTYDRVTTDGCVSEVFDAACNYLCNGGCYTSSGNLSCAGFGQDAIFIKTVWKR